MLNEELQSDFEAIYSVTIGFVLIIFFFSLACALSISEIVIAALFHYSISNCTTNLPDQFIWLIVDGSVGIILMILLIITTYRQEIQYYWYLSCTSSLILLFKFCWLITGSVMFWNDCPSTNPSTVNIILWIVLITSYFGIFIRLLLYNKS